MSDTEAVPHTGVVVEQQPPKHLAKNGARMPAMGFTPQSPDEAYRLATMLSESGLIPDALRGRPKDVLVVLMTGRELGLEPMQSLRMLHVINGKAGMAAELIVAKILESGKAEYFDLISSTAECATYETKRIGSPRAVTLSFTWKQAVAAGLTEGKQGATWKAYPDAKLRARASSHLGRAVYPDVTNGLYDLDELKEIAARPREDHDAVTGEVVEAPVSRVAQLAAQSKASTVGGEGVRVPAGPKPEQAPTASGDGGPAPQVPADVTTFVAPVVPKFSSHAGKKLDGLSTAQLREVEAEGKQAIAKNPAAESASKVALWLGSTLRPAIEERDAALAKEVGGSSRQPGED